MTQQVIRKIRGCLHELQIILLCFVAIVNAYACIDLRVQTEIENFHEKLLQMCQKSIEAEVFAVKKLTCVTRVCILWFCHLPAVSYA